MNERGAREQRPAIEAEPVCRTLPSGNRGRIYSGSFARDAEVLFDRRIVGRKQTCALVTENRGTETVCTLRSIGLVEQLGRGDAGFAALRVGANLKPAGADQERATSVA